MIEKSMLTREKIRILVKEKYGLSIASVNKIDRGMANLFQLVTENGKKFILKEFQSKYNKQAINKEINIIRFLENKKIPVPKYIKLKNKEYSFEYLEHVIIMQEYIEGYTLDKNTGDINQVLESARYLGKLVNALEDYAHNFSFEPDSWFKTDFYPAINKYHHMIKELKDDDKQKELITNDINDKIEMIKQLKDTDFINIDKASVKYTHGDYSVMQFIYKDGKVNAIIDFVSACDMPIIWEIIRSYSYIDKECIDGKFNVDNFISYVKEYMKYARLNKYDLQYMPYIYLIQLLKSTFGYKQYIKTGDRELLEFAILRTNICRYLFKNAEQISKRLLSEITL